MTRPRETLGLAPSRIASIALLSVMLLAIIATPEGAIGADAARSKRILMLFSESKFVVANIVIEQAVRDVLRQADASFEFYAEYLDANRFPEEDYYRFFREYLQKKYAQRPPDLVMAFVARKFELAGQLPAELFPRTPVVFGALTEADLPARPSGSLVTGVIQRMDVPGALNIILQTQPETRRIVVIGGVAPVDQLYLALAEKASVGLAKRVAITFWKGLPVAEMQQAVASLPPRTAILFTTVFRDATGETFYPEQVVARLAESASVPIYVIGDPMVGTGVLGGKVAHLEGLGTRVGELARSVLQGAVPGAFPIEERAEGVPMFDWRALQRWRIAESRLPAGSLVLFRPPSIWDQYRWYLIAAFAIFAAQTAMIGDLLLQRARRRKSERELRESEQRMSLAANAAQLALWEWDVRRNQIWMTEEGRHFFGWKQPGRVTFEDFLETLEPEDREPTRSAVHSALTAGTEYSTEYRVRAENGAALWIAAHGRVDRDGDGRALRMRGVAMDITERKQAEEKFRLAVEASPNAIVMVDHQGRILLVNALAESVFGYARDELIGRSVEILVPERFRSAHPQHRSEFFNAPEARAMGAGRDLFARRKDGSEFQVEIGLNPIQTDQGVLVLTAIVDITERKRAETELQQNREELAHATRILTMGELAASLAHELNQPLTAILSNAQAAQRFLSADPGNLAEVRDILKDIVEDDNRAGEVIRRMRALVKKEELAFSALDLAAMIADIIVLVRSDAILRNVRVSLDLDPDLPPIRGDKVQLQQVLLNLLLNAFDAMKDRPARDREVRVRAARAELGMIEVSVRDRGVGLTTDKLEKIFQPFFTTKRDGLGMGLSISHSIIERHGGRIWAENNTDHPGATFFFSVPIHEEVSLSASASPEREPIV